jgi:hypothetical protein
MYIPIAAEREKFYVLRSMIYAPCSLSHAFMANASSYIHTFR